jgi:hypothetical protein
MDPSVVSYGRLQNGAAIAELLADGWKLILSGVLMARPLGSSAPKALSDISV